MRIRAHEHEHSCPRTRVLLTDYLGHKCPKPRAKLGNASGNIPLDAWKHRSERHLQLNIYVISYSKYRYII